MNTAVSTLGSGIATAVPFAAAAAADAIAGALKDRIANNVVDQIGRISFVEARRALQETAKAMINKVFPNMFPNRRSLPKKIKDNIERNLETYIMAKEKFNDDVISVVEEKIFKPVENFINRKKRQQEQKQKNILGTGTLAGVSAFAPAALQQLRNLFQTDDEIDELGEAAAIPIVGAVKRTPAKIKYYNLFRTGRNVNAKPSQSILNFLKYKL